MKTYKTLTSAFSWQDTSVDFPLRSEVGDGLAGAIACSTKISRIDPIEGKLYYRGIPIELLAGRYTFEEVAFLLNTGKKPMEHKLEFDSYIKIMYDSRNLPVQITQLINSLPRDTHPTRLLRAGISALGCYESENSPDRYNSSTTQDIRIIGQMAEIVRIVVLHTLSKINPPAELESDLATNILTAVLDNQPTQDQFDLLNLLWVLYADNGLDAPTFTGMIVGSCLADSYYNIVAGLSALRGPRLGGTGERVLNQLLSLRDPQIARKWARSTLQQGWRIPGFGHRVYHKADPRVAILRETLKQFGHESAHELLFKVAIAVEDEVSTILVPKNIHTNINFYAAVLFHTLGIKPELIPCMYAVGRIAGIVARVSEYRKDNRLFRPLENYIGTGERHVLSGERV